MINRFWKPLQLLIFRVLAGYFLWSYLWCYTFFMWPFCQSWLSLTICLMWTFCVNRCHYSSQLSGAVGQHGGNVTKNVLKETKWDFDGVITRLPKLRIVIITVQVVVMNYVTVPIQDATVSFICFFTKLHIWKKIYSKWFFMTIRP